MPKRATSAATPRVEDASSLLEVNFMKSMINHHTTSIRMADLALDKADHEALAKIAEFMMDDQNSEVMHMRQWLKEWYGEATTPRVQDQGLVDMLSGLEGRDFEEQFLAKMIEHHAMGLGMAALALEYGLHPQLVKLTAHTMMTQVSDILEMRAMLNAWFDVTNITPQAEDIALQKEMADKITADIG